jgi:hypothetical protein
MITQSERKDFFNIPDQLQLSKEEFETDNFWTTARTNKTLKYTKETKMYYCKLLHYRQNDSTSTGKRVTQFHPKGTCPCQSIAGRLTYRRRKNKAFLGGSPATIELAKCLDVK